MSNELREAAEEAGIVNDMPIESCMSENKGVRKQSVSLFVKHPDMKMPSEYLIDMEGNEPEDSMVADFIALALRQALAATEQSEPVAWAMNCNIRLGNGNSPPSHMKIAISKRMLENEKAILHDRDMVSGKPFPLYINPSALSDSEKLPKHEPLSDGWKNKLHDDLTEINLCYETMVDGEHWDRDSAIKEYRRNPFLHAKVCEKTSTMMIAIEKVVNGKKKA